MAIRDMVSGDAHERSCDSNRLGPNCILSPEGMVSSLVSSRIEFRGSIHSGSMSPSRTGSPRTFSPQLWHWRSAHRLSTHKCPHQCGLTAALHRHEE